MSKKILICLFILFCIDLAVFQYSAEIREPWSEEVSYDWLTASTLKFTENWYRENPLSLRFGMLENPRSIEFPTLLSREPYPSYLPGVIFPIYIISKINGQEPIPSLVMEYNLLNHFLIAFFLSLIIFFFLLQLKFDLVYSLLFSMISIFLELLLPAPLYWHQTSFFADQAVILPFVIFIFLEVVRDNIKNTKLLSIINIFQAAVMFYGILTDWLFIFVALATYIKRVIAKEIVISEVSSFFESSLKYWFPVIFALLLFILQLYVLGIIDQAVDKFLFRTGLSAAGAEYTKNSFIYILKYLNNGYGEIGIVMLFFSLFVFMMALLYVIIQNFKKQEINYKIKKTLYLTGILILPCFLQVCFFKNHSTLHEFSVLKFSVPITTASFVLIPILIYLFLDNTKLKNKISKYHENSLLFIFLITLTLTSGCLIQENDNYSNFFSEHSSNQEELIITLGHSIQKNTQYNYVIFSPDFEISTNPPQALYYSMKRVYKINSVEDIKNKTNNIEGNYRIVLIFLNSPTNEWKSILHNATKFEDTNFNYYIINPDNMG